MTKNLLGEMRYADIAERALARLSPPIINPTLMFPLINNHFIQNDAA